MADVTIGELPVLAEMQDDALIPCEYDGVSRALSGTVLEGYVYNCVEDHVEDIAAIVAVGPQGEPGVSPTLSSSKSGRTTTIYYTDATHPTQTVLATVEDGLNGTGFGDMIKSVYDPNDDGTVEDSDRLGGELASYYMPLAPRIKGVTANYTVQAEDEGFVLACNTNDVVITIPTSIKKQGFRFWVLRWSAAAATISPQNDGTVRVGINGKANLTKYIPQRYGKAELTLMLDGTSSYNTVYWLITGDFAESEES